MRVLGILLLLTALGLGIVWPWAQLNFLGNKVAEVEFASFSRVIPASKTVRLSTSDNPVRIRFKTRFPVDAKLPPLRIPVRIVVTDNDGTLLTGTLSFATNGVGTGPEQGSVSGSQPIEFKVLNDGDHVIYLALAPNDNDGGITDPDVGKVTATVMANAPTLNNDYKAIAAALALGGVYVLFRSRSRRKKPAKSTVRWGRGEEDS